MARSHFASSRGWRELPDRHARPYEQLKRRYFSNAPGAPWYELPDAVLEADRQFAALLLAELDDTPEATGGRVMEVWVAPELRAREPARASATAVTPLDAATWPRFSSGPGETTHGPQGGRAFRRARPRRAPRRYGRIVECWGTRTGNTETYLLALRRSSSTRNACKST